MYLNITPRANNRKYLSIVHGYRDENGKVKKKTIKSLGYLDELEKEFDDPIMHFKAVAKQMDKNRHQEDAPLIFSINKQEKLSLNTDNTKNFGYAALSKLYHELELHTFLKNKHRHFEDGFDVNVIMQTLIYLKLISPASANTPYENKDLLFEREGYDLGSFYSGLMFLYHHKTDMQLWINEKRQNTFNNGGTMLYYNIQNYCSPSHIIRIGIFTDSTGLPVTYELFPCTNNYNYTYTPDLSKIRTTFNMNRIITVSEKGINNANAIWKILNSPSRDGYIFKGAIHNTDRELKNYILNDSDYIWVNDEYKMKSRIRPRAIDITLCNGETATKIIEEKQVVFYSKKYIKRSKGYSLDGYCVLFTSELEEDDDKIIEMYRGLWEAESFFHLTKDKLETRPDSISVHDYIEVHLLTCFLALGLIKLLAEKLDRKYSIEQLMNSLSRSNCVHIQENLYFFTYYDEVLKSVGELLDIPFDQKIMSLGDIKKIIGETKK